MQFAPRFRLPLLVSRITSISRAPPPRCAGDTHPKVGPSAMRPSPATARAGGTWCGQTSVRKGCGGVYDHPRPPSTHRLRPTPHLTPIRAHSASRASALRRGAHRAAGRRAGRGGRNVANLPPTSLTKLLVWMMLTPSTHRHPLETTLPAPLRAVRARASDAENGQFEMIACPIELYSCHPCVARR